MAPRERILVVDDDEQVLQLVQDVLGDRYFVETVADPYAGLEQLKHERYDLVIMDLGMPNLDGAQLIDMVRRDSLNHDVPIIVLSAFDQLRRRTATLPVQGVIRKPFDLAALEENVDKCVT